MPRLWIGGRWIETGAVLDVVNPVSGEPLARVPLGNEQTLEDALAAATRAFPIVRPQPAHERAMVLQAVARGLEQRRQEFIDTIVAEAGKPVTFAEAEVGRAIKDSGLDRADLYVTTKLPPERIKRVRATLSESLSLLGLDHVDLWLIHWPPHGSPATEAWREFRQLRDEGMTTSIGVSNYDVDLIDELVAQTGEAPAVNQVSWSPSLFEAATLAGNRDRGTVLEGYSPLKNTNLRAKELFDISQAHGVTAAQVVLRWHVQHEIPVIPRSQNPERIAANFDLFGFELTADEMARVDAMAI